jgi:hypothetical protein
MSKHVGVTTNYAYKSIILKLVHFLVLWYESARRAHCLWQLLTDNNYLLQVATHAAHVYQTCNSMNMARIYGRNM